MSEIMSIDVTNLILVPLTSLRGVLHSVPNWPVLNLTHKMPFELCFSDWLGTQWSEAEDSRKLTLSLALASNISFLSPGEVWGYKTEKSYPRARIVTNGVPKHCNIQRNANCQSKPRQIVAGVQRYIKFRLSQNHPEVLYNWKFGISF